MYNPEKGEVKNVLPEDLILDAVVTRIQDGVVKDFVMNLEKWKDPEQPCIQLSMETQHEGTDFKFEELFTYRNEGDKVVYSRRSKLGKFAEKYSGLPKVGVKVKALTNSEGYLRLKID